MICDKFSDSIAAFLNGELDERASDELRQHAEECSICADEIRENAVLVDMLKCHPGRNVPGNVEDRVLKSLEPMRNRRRQTSAHPMRLRLQGVFNMKRNLIAAGLVVVIALLAGVFFPKVDPALAAVVEAMLNVQNVHATGWMMENDHKRHFEEWIEGSSKARTHIEGAPDQIIDGEKSIEISEDSVVIRSTEGTMESQRATPIQCFSGDFWQDMVSRSKTVLKADGTLPDGRPALILTRKLGRGDRMVITTDKDTNLVVQIEYYDEKGRLVVEFQHIEYNLTIPNEVFSPTYPASAQVTDMRDMRIPKNHARCSKGESCDLEAALKKLPEDARVAFRRTASNCSEVTELIVKGVQTMDEMANRPNNSESRSWALAKPVYLNIAKTHTLPPGSELRAGWLGDPTSGARKMGMWLDISLADQGGTGYAILLAEADASPR